MLFVLAFGQKAEVLKTSEVPVEERKKEEV
jgi:hypothetical protein